MDCVVASEFGGGSLLSCSTYLELITERVIGCQGRLIFFLSLFFFSFPELKSSQLAFRSADSISCSSLDISGFIEIPGVSVSFLWFAEMLITSHERDILTRIGRQFLFVYFPRRTQLQIELEGIDLSAFCITVVTSSISLVIRIYLME